MARKDAHSGNNSPQVHETRLEKLCQFDIPIFMANALRSIKSIFKYTTGRTKVVTVADKDNQKGFDDSRRSEGFPSSSTMAEGRPILSAFFMMNQNMGDREDVPWEREIDRS